MSCLCPLAGTGTASLDVLSLEVNIGALDYSLLAQTSEWKLFYNLDDAHFFFLGKQFFIILLRGEIQLLVGTLLFVEEGESLIPVVPKNLYAYGEIV